MVSVLVTGTPLEAYTRFWGAANLAHWGVQGFRTLGPELLYRSPVGPLQLILLHLTQHNPMIIAYNGPWVNGSIQH